MKFLKVNPAREFFIENSIPSQFLNSVDSLINQQFNRAENDYHFTPRADVTESEGNYAIHVLLPGVKKENVSVEVVKNKLVISGERKLKTENDTRKFHTVESFEGKFKRVFHLTENIDKENIDAKMEDGILSIELKKVENKTEKTAVTIK
ncbi:MAG: Hsp20/alpha crystallin family protein [Bacteroidota bacterium]